MYTSLSLSIYIYIYIYRIAQVVGSKTEDKEAAAGEKVQARIQTQCCAHGNWLVTIGRSP